MVQDFLRCPSIPQRIENLVVGPQYLGLTECMGRIMSNLSAGIYSSRRFAIKERDMGSSSSGSTVTAGSSDLSPIDIITVHRPDSRVRGGGGAHPRHCRSFIRLWAKPKIGGEP